MQKVNNKLSFARRRETWDTKLTRRLIGLQRLLSCRGRGKLKRCLRGRLWLQRRLRGRLWLNVELGLLRGSETTWKNCVWTAFVGHNGAKKQLTRAILRLNGLEEV